ncbi:ankyrin repeat domain-containing protein [Myxococcota bacterium]
MKREGLRQAEWSWVFFRFGLVLCEKLSFRKNNRSLTDKAPCPRCTPPKTAISIHHPALVGEVVTKSEPGCLSGSLGLSSKRELHLTRRRCPRVSRPCHRCQWLLRRLPAPPWAAGAGHLSEVRKLLQQDVDIDETDQRGETALMKAARAGHTTVVDALIAKGADLNRVDERYGRPRRRGQIQTHRPHNRHGDRRLNVRDAPRLDGKKKTKLRNGRRGVALGYADEWVTTPAGVKGRWLLWESVGKRGWVFSPYVGLIESDSRVHLLDNERITFVMEKGSTARCGVVVDGQEIAPDAELANLDEGEAQKGTSIVLQNLNADGVMDPLCVSLRFDSVRLCPLLSKGSTFVPVSCFDFPEPGVPAVKVMSRGAKLELVGEHIKKAVVMKEAGSSRP